MGRKCPMLVFVLGGVGYVSEQIRTPQEGVENMRPESEGAGAEFSPDRPPKSGIWASTAPKKHNLTPLGRSYVSTGAGFTGIRPIPSTKETTSWLTVWASLQSDEQRQGDKQVVRLVCWLAGWLVIWVTGEWLHR